jgi:hypothetical protein
VANQIHEVELIGGPFDGRSFQAIDSQRIMQIRSPSRGSGSTIWCIYERQADGRFRHVGWSQLKLRRNWHTRQNIPLSIGVMAIAVILVAMVAWSIQIVLRP